MPGELNGQRCIVLRPDPEGAQLVHDLQLCGAEVVHFPTLSIVPLLAPLLPAATPHIVVFVSPNAVRHGASVFPRLVGARIAAIGQGTAAALTAAGFTPQIVSAEGYTSEDLLAGDGLAYVAGLDIWIVRGRGGRPMLGDGLFARGARVHYVEVYERRLPMPSADLCVRVAQLLQSGEAWVIATSPEAFDNLFRLIGAQAYQYRLLTSSARVAADARTAGHRALAVHADGPGNLALLDSLLRWIRQGPGAHEPRTRQFS